MPDINENGKNVAHPGGVKPKVDTEPLKRRIQRHDDVTSDQFLKGRTYPPWLFKSPTDTNEQAQVNQVLRLVESSAVSAGSRSAPGRDRTRADDGGGGEEDVPVIVATIGAGQHGLRAVPLLLLCGAGAGAVRVLDLDMEQMREHLGGARGETFDCIWISEVLFRLHGRQLFFDSAFALLDPGGCLVMADVFRAAHDPASSRRTQKELASIRRNHLCPQLGTVDEYAQMAREAGFRPRHEPVDITKNVAKTW
ncbi:hypothetical protein DL768_003250 [Monosporascus sp. mg162]|nr:hypothetical protein DL768_003250 [Monosporascus sp. mg162]